ncbi:MAG: hypothetical protein U1F26_14460 [Lysobacterales bacterium]
MSSVFLMVAAILVVLAAVLFAGRKAGSGLLAFALVFSALMIVFTFTPMLWILSGSPSESYPELLGGVIGIPAGICLTLAAATRFWLARRRERMSKPA